MARKDVVRKNNRVTSYQDAIFQSEGPVVYFVGTTANDLVKVGHTVAGFRQRFARIASQSPVPILALGILMFTTGDASQKAEAAIQIMLTKGNRHSHGEWYRLPISGIQSIANHFAKLGVRVVLSDCAGSVVQETCESEQEIYFKSLVAPRMGMAAAQII